MADEPTGAEPKEQNEATEDNERNSPAFKGVLQQLSEKNKALTQAQTKLDKLMQDQANAKAEAEKADLEARGKYDVIIKAKEAEIEALTAKYAQETLNSAVKVALLGADAKNDLFISGAVAAYTGDTDGIADYVAALKADEGNAPFFGAAQPAQGIPPAQKGAPAGTSVTDWKKLKHDLTDPEKAKAASKAVTEYVLANDGQMPPGFD